MRSLAALILLLAFGPARAAPSTDQLPAGAVGLLGFDLAAFRASKVGQAAEKLATLKAKNPEASRKLNDQLGIDSAKDLHGLVVALYPGPDGKVSEKNASAVVLLRGEFDPARFAAFARKHNLPTKTFGDRPAWEAGAFIEKLSGEKPKDGAKGAYVVVHSNRLVIVAGEECLDRALAAADRNEKAAILPAEVAAKFGAATGSWLFLYADATKMKNTKEDAGAEDLSLVLGESATDLQLATAAGFVSAEKASAMRKQLKGLQAFAMIGLSDDDGKTPSQKEDQALLSELVQKIRIGGDGKQVTLDLDFPTDKAVRAIAKVVEKSQKGPAAPAAK